VGHIHDGGQPREAAWVASVASGSAVAGICDTVACTPPRPDDFRMIRLGDARFTTAHRAEIFAVVMVGNGAPGCRTEDRIGYDLTIVKEGSDWVVASKRGTMQAWMVESLCVAPSGRRP
jgi:hypothetical protein